MINNIGLNAFRMIFAQRQPQFLELGFFTKKMCFAQLSMKLRKTQSQAKHNKTKKNIKKNVYTRAATSIFGSPIGLSNAILYD